MRIKKTSETTPTMASIVNATNNSTTDAYSCDYVNKDNTYSTSEIKTNKVWIDGKPIYKKVFSGTYNTDTVLISNVDTLVNAYGTANIANVNRFIPFFLVYNNINYGATIELRNNNVQTSFTTSSSNISITIEYTKTTD